MGNLTSDSEWTYTWEHGSQLSGMTKTGTTAAFGYNADGLRTQKTVNGTTTKYFYAGNQLTFINRSGNKLHFVYDSIGPVTVTYNSTVYYYLRNAQGDITGITDNTGAGVVYYFYDAWGNPTSVSGSMANTLGKYNPFRYRGYVYDEETGLYYLNSRYYDPELCRFISADSLEYLGATGDLNSYNLFAYCMNNPVNRIEINGNWSLPNWAKKTIASVAVVAVVAAVAAVTVATAGAGTASAVIAISALKGAAFGMASGAAIGAGTSAIKHRVQTGNWNGVGEAALNGMGDGALSGAITGGIAGAVCSGVKVMKAATAWDSGTFNSGYDSLNYHYNKHVLQEGFSQGNNVVKYTKDALNFANRNISTLQYTYNYAYGNASWNSVYSTGQGGMFNSAGKIITFWYK